MSPPAAPRATRLTGRAAVLAVVICAIALSLAYPVREYVNQRRQIDALVAQQPDTGAVLLECTNMVPYARALSERLRLPVFSIYSFVIWFHAGLVPRDFGPPGSGDGNSLGEWRER